MLAGVDEDVHAGVRRRQRGAVQRAGEDGCRHELFELRAVHAVADDDQLQVVAARQHREPLDVLLRRQPADEPDDRLARRGPPPRSVSSRADGT